MFRTPKNGQKMKFSKIPTSLFLNHTKMTLINFQWILIKIEDLCTKKEDFDQTYLNTGSNTQNVEEFSLDIPHNFW